jgi:incFII family plasmid replication initiator RepA
MAELGLITYQTEYDPQIGCNIPTDITFTPALFSALDVSDVAVVAARAAVWNGKISSVRSRT